MKKSTLLFPLLFFCLPLFAQFKSGQHVWEAGAILGLLNYSGDLTSTPMEIAETRLGYGAFVRYNFNKNFAFRAQALSGVITGDDRHSDALRPRSIRFGAALVECSGVLEFTFFARDRFSSAGFNGFHVSPYLFGGAGALFVNPEAEYYGLPENRDQELRTPLPEEGLRRSLLVVPMGAGLRFDLFDRLLLSGEIGVRNPFSDDLDGVKVNGDPNDGDWYYFGGLAVAFMLNNPYRRH